MKKFCQKSQPCKYCGGLFLYLILVCLDFTIFTSSIAQEVKTTAFSLLVCFFLLQGFFFCCLVSNKSCFKIAFCSFFISFIAFYTACSASLLIYFLSLLVFFSCISNSLNHLLSCLSIASFCFYAFSASIFTSFCAYSLKAYLIFNRRAKKAFYLLSTLNCLKRGLP